MDRLLAFRWDNGHSHSHRRPRSTARCRMCGRLVILLAFGIGVLALARCPAALLSCCAQREGCMPYLLLRGPEGDRKRELSGYVDQQECLSRMNNDDIDIDGAGNNFPKRHFRGGRQSTRTLGIQLPAPLVHGPWPLRWSFRMLLRTMRINPGTHISSQTTPPRSPSRPTPPLISLFNKTLGP